MVNFRMQKSVYIYTYGCQMNVHDSEKMFGVLAQSGYVRAESAETADLIIFNTCAIREKAEQKFFSQLGRVKVLKRRRADIRIAVTGCVAQEAKDKLFVRAPHVDFVVGPSNLHRVGDLVSTGERRTYLEDDPDLGNREFSAQRENGIKCWVSIMYGCNNFCSYCIVPYTRGREISRPSAGIISEVRKLVEKGYKEVTLLGQNVNSYKSDIDFPELLRRIDALGIGRVRFVTSHPRDLSPRLIDAIAELPSVCEHIHLPLQSGSDEILRRMNRRYSYARYLENIKALRLRVPDIAITTDLIVGFPGESEDAYEDTVQALKEIEFDGIFAFKFSKRRGTAAFGMEDQISEEVKAKRLGRILDIQEGVTYNKNKLLEGSVQEILVEGPSETDPDMLVGRSRMNKIVTIPEACGIGDFVMARIERARLHSLEGAAVGRDKSAECV